jgi:hypothetical protein
MRSASSATSITPASACKTFANVDAGENTVERGLTQQPHALAQRCVGRAPEENSFVMAGIRMKNI